jgi:dTDP-4-dehydrorhamnose 3,5-epimerase-like enzyme
MTTNKHDAANEPLPAEILVSLPDKFVDERGFIQPLIDTTIRSCVLISSKEGSRRADHYHKTDWHYCYILSGSIEYYQRPVGDQGVPEKVTLTAGQMFFTPPLAEHTMYFLEDTVFLAFGRNSRVQESYEGDLIRITSLHK